MHSESEGEPRVRWGRRGFIASFFAVEETGAPGAAMEAGEMAQLVLGLAPNTDDLLDCQDPNGGS